MALERMTTAWWGTILILMLMIVSEPILAQRYSGVWQNNTQKERVLLDATWGTLQNNRRELRQRGFRLIDIEVSLKGNVRKYSAVWHSSGGAERVWLDATWAELTAKAKSLSDNQELKLVDVEVYEKSGELRYIGLFRPVSGSPDQILETNMTWDGFKKKQQDLLEERYQLVDIETYIVNNERRYVGIFNKGGTEYTLWRDIDWQCFRAIRRGLEESGFRLRDIEIYRENNKNKFIGLWEQARGNDRLWVLEQSQIFLNKWREFGRDNLRLVDLEVDP